MARKFQIKRGLLANLPTLAQGELAMTTNSGGEKLFIGNGTSNLEVTLKKDLTSANVGALSDDLGGGYIISVEYGDHTYIRSEVDSSVPNVPTSGSYAFFIITNRVGPMDAVLALPVSGTDKVYFYTVSVKKWEHVASTDYAVAKTGDQVMTGNLTMPSFVVTDGYVNMTAYTEGPLNRGEIRVSNRNTGETGSLLVTTSGPKWMDEYSEYHIIHTGNMTQLMGVMSASLE